MTDDRLHFDLVDEQWIPVRYLDGSARELSIRQVLSEASTIRSIGGDIPTQAFAIQRILLAIVRRAIEWGPDPVERWERIWLGRQLPEAEIECYLERVRDRFDLLHPATPFYQVPDFRTSSGEFKPASLLISDIPPGAKYFTTRAGSGAERLSFAEAARWVVHCQAFDPSGIKSGDPRDPRTKGGKNYPIGVAWAGQLGGVVFEGGSLFDTLMLNTVLHTGETATLHPDDVPVWERDHPSVLERANPVPTGPADVLTWQSRRICLRHDGSHVTGVLIGNGDPLAAYNRHHVEFMTAWRYSEPQSKKYGEDRFFPRTLDPNRSLWRGLDALLADVPDRGIKHGLGAGVANWLDFLTVEGVLDHSLFIRPHALGFEYINQSSVIGASVDDELRIRVAVVGRRSEAREYANRAVQIADAAVTAVVNLAGNLVEAAGGDAAGPRDSARARTYFELDTPYRRWIADLGADTEFENYLGTWQHQVRDIVSVIGRDLIADAGEPAWIGRKVRDRWLDSSLASGFFWSVLRKALPAAFDTDLAPKGVTS